MLRDDLFFHSFWKVLCDTQNYTEFICLNHTDCMLFEFVQVIRFLCRSYFKLRLNVATLTKQLVRLFLYQFMTITMNPWEKIFTLLRCAYPCDDCDAVFLFICYGVFAQIQWKYTVKLPSNEFVSGTKIIKPIQLNEMSFIVCIWTHKLAITSTICLLTQSLDKNLVLWLYVRICWVSRMCNSFLVSTVFGNKSNRKR